MTQTAAMQKEEGRGGEPWHYKTHRRTDKGVGYAHVVRAHTRVSYTGAGNPPSEAKLTRRPQPTKCNPSPFIPGLGKEIC